MGADDTQSAKQEHKSRRGVMARHQPGRILALLLAGALVSAAPRAAAAQETIKIGFFGPTTERFAGLGLDAKKGADLAIKQANEAGGINNRKLELVVYDDRGNRTEAVGVARQLIEQDKGVAIVSRSPHLPHLRPAPPTTPCEGPPLA